MDERAGLRTNSMTYGAIGPSFEANYLMNPDLERAPLLSASGYMSPAIAPPPDGAVSTPLTNSAIGPPPTEWAAISGHKGVASADEGGRFLLSPDPTQVPDTLPMPVDTNWIIPISEDVARKALLDYAESKCCYGSTPAEDMEFRELRTYNTYRYRLETFTESRSCKWVTKPHTGEAVDSPDLGSSPMPWDIPIPTPTMFRDNRMTMAVPHTSSVKICPQCLGIGRTVCRKCHGTGQMHCWPCNGTGSQIHNSCVPCRGKGTRNCIRYVTCEGCEGSGKILNYIKLTITWKNNIYEFISEQNSEFPTDLFRKVNGEKVITEEHILLSPLVHFPTPTINQASQNALQQHHSQFSSTSRILRQRHAVEFLPLTMVDYVWDGDSHNYFVYGKENKVFTDNYPQKCCCVVM